jgi:hypothetical protein
LSSTLDYIKPFCDQIYFKCKKMENADVGPGVVSEHKGTSQYSQRTAGSVV